MKKTTLAHYIRNLEKIKRNIQNKIENTKKNKNAERSKSSKNNMMFVIQKKNNLYYSKEEENKIYYIQNLTTRIHANIDINVSSKV